jgi:hypothetical protein
VETDFKPDFEVLNPSKRLRFKSLQRFLTNPPSVLRPFARVVARVDSIRKLTRRSFQRFNTEYEERQPLAPELRRRLRAEFAQEVERLSELLGRDLTHWSRD